MLVLEFEVDVGGSLVEVSGVVWVWERMERGVSPVVALVLLAWALVLARALVLGQARPPGFRSERLVVDSWIPSSV